VITPWNGPLLVPMVDIAPALMAGCAVLSKPSEFTPLCWQLMIAGWREIGAPESSTRFTATVKPALRLLTSSTS
jgi:acyl-CoA reductase-like NAD-dependent aldehyde dehydrogenase